MSLKSMYSIDITLREFISQIPSCLQEDSLETVLAAAQSGKSEIIAIVNNRGFPVGIIHCHSLLCLLTHYCQQPVTTLSVGDRSDHQSSVKAIEALIKPATILQSSITIEELRPYFTQNLSTISQTQTFLIVNTQGELLGLLDAAKLLRYLLLSSQTKLPTPLGNLIDLLEAIALPAKLQAANGRVVYENIHWRQFISKILLKSNPIAQWWLEQQIDHNHCLKASHHLISPQEISQLTDHWDSRDRATDDFPAIPNLVKSEANDGNYLQIPINLVEKEQNAGQTKPLSCYQLIVALPPLNMAFSPEPSQDAELIELNRLKDELLANISHELKSPLTGIVGLSSLLKEKKLGNLNQRQLRYAELIYRSGRQLINLVSELLDLTSLTTGKLQLNLEPIELNSFCREVYQQVITKLTANAANISLSKCNFQLNIEKNSEIAIADKLRLRQILAHLLSNSLKYSAPQGTVGIDVASHSNWLTITVWDLGVGIPEVKQRSLLQPWDDQIPAESVDQETSYTHSSGINLSSIIAQQLAKVHGGDISFISKVGSGSEFTLWLPVRSEPPIVSDQVVYENSNSLVLLVETRVEQIEQITSWLRELNYSPIVARTGTEALQKARCLQPNYILLNPTLPLLSGQDLLTLLKSNVRTAHCSVVVMTNGHGVEHGRRGVQALEETSRDSPLETQPFPPHPQAPPMIGGKRVTANQSTLERELYRQADQFIALPLTKMDLAAILPSVREQSPERLSNLTASQPRQALTILCLYPEPEFLDSTKKKQNIGNSNFNLKDWAERDWTNQSSDRYDYRIIEADGLEQADMLAKIWQLDTIVLDGSGLKTPLTYLRSLHELETLAALPLVTLDSATTQAANKIEGLTIYPCLIPAKSRSTMELMQVIQIAAGINER